jgi:hypothetical protein
MIFCCPNKIERIYLLLLPSLLCVELQLYIYASHYWSTTSRTIHNQYHTDIAVQLVHHPKVLVVCITLRYAFQDNLYPTWRHCCRWSCFNVIAICNTVCVIPWSQCFPLKKLVSGSRIPNHDNGKNNGMIPKYPELYPVFMHFLGVDNTP